MSRIYTKKKCVIRNYVPHKTPVNPNFYKWFYEYENNLADIYGIIINIIRDRYPDINFDIFNNDDYFNFFINHIFDSSSKFIF